VDGQEIEFSEGFTDLHTVIYRDMLAGKGFGIDDVRPSLELAQHLRTDDLVTPGADAHPMLKR
jgi:UDP-N-acetyl-2-amino-2-deoxyglucuronate dehydrogenase